MRAITLSLWLDDDLEQAVEFYTSVFPDGKVHGINRTPDGNVPTAGLRNWPVSTSRV